MDFTIKMDSQPIAHIYYRLVRILAYHEHGYTCVDLKTQRVNVLKSESREDCMIVTIKLENGIEKFTWNDNIYYVKEFYFHREDGPAIIYIDPEKKSEFWLAGKRYQDAESYFEALTPEQKLKAVFNMNEIKS